MRTPATSAPSASTLARASARRGARASVLARARAPPSPADRTPRLTPPRPSPLVSGADSYTMTEAERPRVMSRDPAGFTIVDVAAWGSLAHIISAGEILGQKAAGFF